MSRPDEFSFRRYLTAKRTVDDRALHRPTLDRLTDALGGAPSPTADDTDRPLRVLEVAAGVGTGLQRLLAWDSLPEQVDYTLLDSDDANVATARERLPDWATDEGYTVEFGSDGRLELSRDDESVTVSFVVADALDYADRLDERVDLLVGQAFVDLVDLDSGLPALFDLVADGGLVYFPITFDGVTHFSPRFAAADRDGRTFERRLLDAYHATMDASDRPGSSTTGRDLFTAVADAGGEVVAAGGSDWVVHPPYPADEAYFLHHLVDTVAGAVEGDVDGRLLAQWTDARHEAIQSSALTFLAHNLDLLVRVKR